MFADRIAKTRNYGEIERIAEKARRLGGIDGHSRFNIIEYLQGPLRYIINCELGFELFEKGEYAVPAFVRYHSRDRITLFVEKTVWFNARAGFPEAKYIVAHEIGHIVMHTHNELAFTTNPNSVISDLPPEDRTEPQANLFADLFLLPTKILEGFTKADEIEYYFDVPLNCAERRLHFIMDMKRRSNNYQYTGDACLKCANFTLVRNGTCLKCDTCGGTTGCS